MKRVTLLKSMVLLSLGLVMIGCGDSDSDDTTKSTAVLDNNKIDTLGTNAAEVLPGCVYTSNNVSAVSKNERLASYKTVLDIVKTKSEDRKIQKTTIDESVAGECGGTLTTVGEHDDGDDDVVYSFNNYCSDGTIINGSAHVVTDGTPTDSGPVTDALSLSTQSGGLEVRTVEDGVSITETIYIDNLKWTKEGSLRVDELKVVSPDGTYRVSNVDVIQNSDAETIQIRNATYEDPDVGTLSVSSSVLPTNSDATGSASITVTGSEGSAVFETNDVSSQLFTVTNADGTTVGGLDCSGIAIQ